MHTYQGGSRCSPLIFADALMSTLIIVGVLMNATFVKSKYTKFGVKIMFKNLDEEVEQMKPYFLLTSDVLNVTNSIPSKRYGPIAVSGQIRMTYVDN